MNPMNDQRFFDLAMKVIANQSTDAERTELDALLARQPELKAEFERLRGEAALAREVLPLVDATQATAGEFPTYARGRLQTKVRQTFGRPKPESEDREGKVAWLQGWRWWLGLATAAALIAVLLVPVLNQPRQITIQLAMLDVAGGTRSTETNEVAVLESHWPGTRVQTLSTPGELAGWAANWPGAEQQPAAKIIYDRSAGEVRVLGRWRGKPFQKTFPVEQDLAAALNQAKTFVLEQTRQ